MNTKPATVGMNLREDKLLSHVRSHVVGWTGILRAQIQGEKALHTSLNITLST